MRTPYLLLRVRLIGFFMAVVALTMQAAAQRPIVLSFTSTPCDSAVCDSLIIINSSIFPEEILAVTIRDSVSYAIGGEFVLPQTVLSGSRVAIPLCFYPNRRGTIVDSLMVVIGTADGQDTVLVRLAGKGIGPELHVEPIAVNFPKTNVGTSSTETILIRNSGELPYQLTTLSLNIPPPFQLITSLPLVIPAGGSATIDVEFRPTEYGVYSVPIDLKAGCSFRLRLDLNGATELIGTGAVLRISKSGFSPANNEQLPCGIGSCTDITFSNVGNAPLVIEDVAWEVGAQGFSFTTPPITPFSVPANSQRTFQVCVSSQDRGMLKDTLKVTSNTRSAIAFGMVLDVSGSMRAEMHCGSTVSNRLEQAIIQANNFIQRTLLYLPSINLQDQLAICSYSSSNSGETPKIDFPFPLAPITDASRTVAQAGIAGLKSNGGTPTGAAVKQMVDMLAQSDLHNRVIVLLSDGDAEPHDRRFHPPASVVQHAQDNGVKIFTIGVGLDGNGTAAMYLRELANGTGGVAFDASDNDCQTLQNAFEAITDIVSRGTTFFEPFAVKVIAPNIAASPSLVFDTVHVHKSICSSITLTNIGEGEAIVDSATVTDALGGATTEFHIPSDVRFPIRIPEGEQVVVPVCFTPDTIRMRYGKLSFRYNNCGQKPTSTDLSGAAYAVANLRVSDLRIGLPGDIVTMPIYVDTSLADYAVATITYEVRWNNSMLDLRTVLPGAEGLAVIVEPVGPVAGRDAVAHITVTGDGLRGSGELVALEFQVLRGDALFSDVTLTEARFEDGNPKVILSNGGMVAFDSTCFRESKPLSNTGASKLSVGDASPTPARGRQVVIPVAADGETAISLEIVAADGRVALPRQTYHIDAGTARIQVDLSTFPPGSYYAVLTGGSGETFLRKILIAR